VTIDVGTGDGRAVLELAARQPQTLVLGLDASAASMADASRRAARQVRKGGLPNAAFVLAAAESPPAELCGVAGLVTIRFPWGSLLRGCLGLDAAAAAGVAGLVGAGGRIELLLAPSERDGLDAVPTEVADVVAAAARTFAAHGFELEAGRRATAEEVDASGSTWARRLRAGRSGGHAGERKVTLVRLIARAGR
jgi:16S rRNA (adenine(1408)-N(1))-methyltransferase